MFHELPDNFVFGHSFAPYGVFRKHGRAAHVTAPSRFPIGHLKQCQGAADCGPLPARNALFGFAVLAQAGKAWVPTTATASVTAPAPATVTATHTYTAPVYSEPRPFPLTCRFG